MFGFHPSMNVGASRGSSDGGRSRTSTSQYGASNVTEFSIGIAVRSLNENRKFEYPPTRNSPLDSSTSPNVTRGPTASKSRTSSSHGTGLWPPSGPSGGDGIFCAPQHMNTNRSGSAVSVAPVLSSVTTTRENSNATVTPRKETTASPAFASSRVTTRETYISLAAAAPPEVSASTAPTRMRSSDGSDVHVVTLNLRAPFARSAHAAAAAAAAAAPASASAAAAVGGGTVATPS